VPRLGRGVAGALRAVARASAIALIGALGAIATAAPECRYDDVVLTGDLMRDAVTLLVDPIHRLPADAEPTDLVRVQRAGFASDHLVRAVLLDDLRALREAAVAEGHALAVQSAYRSYAYQRRVFDGWVARLGRERALRVSARPGHSEHQLGTAIDFRSADGPPAWELADWGATPEGAWLAAHAHRFGFVLSYPAGKESFTCYDYEPWHYRWVGSEAAAAIHASGITLREWLYRHHPPGVEP
jgi:zinc D-Ala-D-Ala carboxypeptidase